MGRILSPAVITNGLVFYFDPKNRRSYAGAGITCNDLMGNSTTGEAVNSPTFDSSGFFTFNASSNYLRFTNSTALDVQTFTIEVWVKTNATTQNGFWFEKGTVNTQYSLFQEGTAIKSRINNGSTLVDTMATTTATYMNTSNWYQVVFTFTTGTQALYINGVQRNSGTTSATLATNSGGMSIGVYGGYSGARGYYYNGSQSITKVYNRVLTVEEIGQNFNAIKGRFGIV